jgi:tetratricopeptide (TPR) repeat protein
MKFFAALVFFLLAAGLPSAHAQQNADDEYLYIYGAIQQADTFAGSGQSQRALAEYATAQSELQKFQRIYPDWNPNIVKFRLKYLAGKIADATTQLPPAAAPVRATIPPTPKTSAPNATPVVAPAPPDAEVAALRAQLQQLQADNTTLAAKLKEALSVQPATIDSRELAKAQQQIQSLMKENDLLKTSLAQAKMRTNIVSIAAESDALKQAQAALVIANRKLAAQIERADNLEQENVLLQTRVQTLMASPDSLEAVRAENALLKKQIAELKLAAAKAPDVTRIQDDERQARLQVAALQSDAQVRQLEKAALENRIKKLQAAAARPAPPAPVAKLNDEIKTLRGRIAVDEAQAVPYTAEELALFQTPAPVARKKAANEMPAGSAALVAQAQSFFVAREFNRAETNYLQILQRDPGNVAALGNLAAIEMEEGKLDDAEKNLKAALAQNPDDAYNLSKLGYLKFQQGKYDDALDALGRAAKLDPQNPEIQNYLGVALSHKGLRVSAETALRKAIQLDPNYAAAQNNLAVIYLSQSPPLVQLARWHYQKALDAGQPRNPDFEKALDAAAPPPNP